ncbi:hypothetical protein G3I19_17585 [Streptomyces sp. SID10853]|uniref:hypothetical protein n=1 Tax=Streptomyces sp. SID10853 TaxID=2706028 RepID=UPI0013C0E102|nr:hypothetical protein [Streptomyces sp. SID10853]NDZ80304.1 hypothetical protein [Streptomyces sp. SID10853]
MSSGQKTVTVFLTLIGGLLLVIIGLYESWPRWAWPAAAVPLLAAPVLVIRFADRRVDPFPAEFMPDLPVPPVERRELRISDVALPSAADDYDFLFSATVRWCPVSAPPGSPPVNASGLAVDALLDRARAVTALRSPTRSSLVQHELNGVLGTMQEDASGRVQAMALEVGLTLSDRDQERLAALASVRKDEAVWEHERKFEQSRRTYLGKDVLRDTGSAVVWWLHRNDDRVDRTVKDIGLLAQLTSAANNQDVEERFRHLVDRPPEEGPELAPGGVPGPFAGPGGSPVTAPGEAEEPEPAGNGLGDAFAQLVEATGLPPEDPVIVLLAGQVSGTLRYLDGDPAAEIRTRFHSTPGPPPPHVNGAGPAGPPPPAESVPF